MNTNGWDTVFVVAASAVNAALDSHKSDLRMRFDADPGTDPPVQATGNYTSWRVVAGGSERWMYLSLDIAEGTLSVGTGTPSSFSRAALVAARKWETATYDLAGVSVVVAVDLRLVQDRGTTAASIEFNLAQAGHSMPPQNSGDVVPVRIVDPSGNLNVAASSLLGYAIADDLVRNAAQVTYVLGRINPIPPGVDSWLSPTSSSFAFVARQDGSTSIAVLSMTQNRSADGLSRAVEAVALPEGLTASYLVSSGRVLENMLLPVLPEAYDTDAGSFRYDASSNRIVQARSFGTFSVKSGAITYYPQITEFEMRVEGGDLRSDIRGTCDMGIGITMSFHVNAKNQTSFDANTRTMTFLPDDDPISDSNADIPWYLMLAGPLVVAITEICVAVISKDIASRLNDLLRNALAITKNPPRPIEFTGTRQMQVSNAGLNGCLYLFGNIDA